ncbi:MAG: GxGYxYP family putative glycoside hydrolase [Armatimonadetes bacterium]|nr:GxGYxYP family putative glycoside hydrolase [Armatimonadota bacterium]
MLLVALSLMTAVGGTRAYWLDMAGLDYERQVTTFCLQGIVNRDAPRLFLDTAPIFWQWPPSDRHWREYLEKRKGYTFVDIPGLPAAIARFRGLLNGLVVYDPSVCDAQRAIACTYASVERCLPVASSLLAAEPAAFEGLVVRHDLRGEFTDPLDAYGWAEGELLPRCARGLCYSMGHSSAGTNLGGDPAALLSLDYVVSEGGFVFNLSPVERQEGDWQAYPEQAELFSRFVRKLGPLTAVWGWAEPEGAFARTVSQAGGFIMCPGPNMSFWRKVQAEKAKLPTPPRRVKKLENKCYLCFQTNEGDTPKILCSFFAGGWLSADRGSAPVAWGINPLIGSICPALFEYFAATASPNDSFFAGVSGAGYCFPDLLPDARAFYRWTERHCAATNVRAVDVWLAGLRAPLDVFADFHAEAPSVTGFTMPPKMEAMNRWLPDATPVLACTSGLFYFGTHSGAAELLAARIREVAETHPKPCFITLYGGVGPGICSIVNAVTEKLGEGYEAVTINDFMALAREAGRFQVSVEPPFLAPDETAVVRLVFRGLKPLEKVKAQVRAFGETKFIAGQAAAPGGAQELVEHLRWRLPECLRPGSYKITARSGEWTRAARLWVATEAQVLSDFADASGWVEAGARLSANGLGRVTCPEDAPFASVRLPVVVDFDRDPVVEITVTESEGAWALKANDGTLAHDAYLVPDTSATGTFTARLRDSFPDWRGNKTFHLILFACGSGKTVTVKSVRLLYLK